MCTIIGKSGSPAHSKNMLICFGAHCKFEDSIFMLLYFIISRETPTSAGPNSFGKTKQGFCDAKKVFEKNLKHALETVEGRKGVPKFPQTIYKISGGTN